MKIQAIVPRAFDIVENDSPHHRGLRQQLNVAANIPMKKGVVFYQRDCHLMEYNLQSDPYTSLSSDLIHWIEVLSHMRVFLQQDANAVVSLDMFQRCIVTLTASLLPHTHIKPYFETSQIFSSHWPRVLDLSTSVPLTEDDIRHKAKKKTSTKTMLPCAVCGKSFDRPSLLKRHTRTHTGEKPHICEVCSKGFSTSSSLNTHRRIHSGERPHVCPVCFKTFTASSNLYYHRITHVKDKPHKCTTCNKSFPTPGNLRTHSFSHTGSWPYQCSICLKGFAKTSNLKSHMNIHHRK